MLDFFGALHIGGIARLDQNYFHRSKEPFSRAQLGRLLLILPRLASFNASAELSKASF